MKAIILRNRPPASFPFYCRPPLLFIFIWLIMLGSARFEITDVSYPSFTLPLELFAASALSFLLGYYLVRLALWREVNSCTWTSYRVDVTRLRRLNLCLICAAVALMGYNYALSGLPPFFLFFGFSTESVNGYGKLKQLLGPTEMAVFINAFLDVSARRRVFYALFGFVTMLLYVARGAILLMLFQALVVISLRTSLSKRKIYFVAFAGVLLGGIFFGLLGSYRTSDALLFAGMQIKKEYQEWPSIYVWIISYVSAPLSNLCWFIKTTRFDHVTWTFAYQLIPSFWSLRNPHQDLMAGGNIVDGVHTYLSNYFFDFSYFGIFALNLLIGMASGFGTVTNQIGRNFLPWSVFLSCIAFMFFWDFFSELFMVVLFGIQMFVQWYCVRSVPQTFPRTNRRHLASSTQ